MRSWSSRLALLIALALPVAASAQSRIDQLSAGASVSSTDAVPNCQSCGSSTAAVKTTMAQILTWIESAFQKATSSQFGVVEVDGTTITASGGVISAVTGGSGTVTSVGLAAGLAKTVGTRNTGSDAITTTGTANLQTYPVTKASSYTVNADFGGTSDTGALLIATGASVTFTMPNPGSGTKGNCYSFGSDGTNGYTLTTSGGTATIYGYSGGGGTSVVFPANRDVLACDDSTNYKATVAASPIIPLALTVGTGLNPNNYPIANISEPKIITGIRCTPEVVAGGTATVQPVKAASGTALSSGTSLTSNTCNANTGAGTDQSLTVSVTTLAAGDRLGITTSGFGTTNGVFVITVFVR